MLLASSSILHRQKDVVGKKETSTKTREALAQNESSENTTLNFEH
jgi:hypothetical protein